MIIFFVTFSFFIVISCLFKVLLKNFFDISSKSMSSIPLRKTVRIRSYSGPYFPAFGLNTERYFVSLRMWTFFTQCSCNAFIFTPTELLRRVASNFWEQGRCVKIRLQILNRCERLNYIQTLQRTSLKNNYLNQVQIILADILDRACNFIKKKIHTQRFQYFH